jgi:hypothetical protein
VKRVGVIHPSALHWAAVCPRRFVGMHGADQLPPTLAAVRGRILHAVRELLATQQDRSAAGLRGAAEAAFLAARAREQGSLEQRSWWEEWFDLADHLAWRSARSLVLPSANRLAGQPPTHVRTGPRWDGVGAAVADEETGISDGLDPLPGVEVRVSSAELRLRGVIDEVRASEDGWIVVEMKSTELAAGGEAARTQVLAYALALESLGAGTVAHCEILGPRGPTRVPFDDGARQRALQHVELARAADGSETSPGSATCGRCPVRNSCFAFREWAERQWREQQPSADGDVWGRVDAVKPGILETVDVELTRPGGGRALIRGVPSTRAGILASGDVAAFGLSTTGTRRLHGVDFLPTALHERPVGVAQGLPPGWGAVWQSR